MTLLIDARVTAAGSRDEVAGADLAWPTPSVAPTPPDVPGFGAVEASVKLDGTAPLELPTKPVITSWSQAIELVVGWDDLRGPATILGGTFPVSVRLLVGENDENNNAMATVEATVHTNGVTRVLHGTVATPTDAVALAVVAVGDNAVLAINGTAVDRRPMGAGALLAWPGIEGPVLVGGATAATELFTGRVWAARFSDTVPDLLVQAVTDAADSGMGELDAHYEDTGGTAGPITQSEQVFGGVHWREHANATLCWSPSTGAHDVRGPFRDAYRSLGGALGSLGLPSSDELSMTAYLDLVDSKRRKSGSSGLRLDDVLVNEVPDVLHVLDVADVPAGIISAETEVTNDFRTRSLADAIATNPIKSAMTRESLPSALVNARTLSLAPADPTISPTVRELFTRLTNDSLRLDTARRFGQTFGAGKQRLKLPVHHDGTEDFDVQRSALDLATAFVRNADVSSALTAWKLEPETSTDLKQAPALIADMIAAADRSDRVTRIVDDRGIGYILQGPRAVRFERGAIIWAPGTGAMALFSDILLHWLRHGGSDGFLGLPVSADAAVGPGRMATFAGGIVVWSPDSGVHEVHGAILGRYLSLGGPTGTLGFPTSDEEDVPGVPGAKTSSFQNGDIYWTSGSGAVVLRGDIRAAYLRGGGPGRYGVPLTDEVSRTAADGSGVEVRHTTFSSRDVLAWVDGIGVFDHVVLDVGSVRSGEIDDEVTSDDAPELYVFTTIWVDGVQAVVNRTPEEGSGDTQMTLDAIAPVNVPLHEGATVRIEVKAWDEDLGPDDQFATHDLTYTFEDGFFGWLSALRGSHLDAPSTWDDGDTDPDDFKVSYTLAPPFDELARFDRFRQEMWWSFKNFTGPNPLAYQLYADTFEDVPDSSGALLLDDILHPVARTYYLSSYKSVADKGNCMGMGLLAANTFYHRTGLTEPLIAFGETDVLHDAINRAHGIQTGDAATMYKLMVKCAPGWLDPRQIFKRVKYATDRKTPVLLNMRGDDPDGDNVGHSTLAYRTDDSSWPHRIWICDPNQPVKNWADDDGSRIEIDEDGAFRMYAKGAVRDTYGAGAFSGTIGDSYLYEIPVSVLQGPHYTPNWVMAAGLAIIGSIMQFVGDGEVRQVSGGGRQLFGDQRGPARSSLESTRAQLEVGLAARLIQADALVPAVSPVVSPTLGLARFAMSTALASQLSRLTTPGSSLTQAVAQLEPTVVTAVQQAWAGQLTDGVASAIADLGERLATINDVIDIGAIFDATERLFTPGAWPEMAFIEREDAAPGEMFVHQGALPADLSFELLGRGGQFSHWVNTRQAGAMVAGALASEAHSTLRFDRLSSLRPGVRVETDQAATQVQLGLTVAAYENSSRWVGWDTTVTAGAGAPAASLVRAEVPLGVTITSAAAGSVVLRSGERIGEDVRPKTSWLLPSLAAGERLRVEPADAASPFGAVRVQRDSAEGALLDRVVVEPMG